MLKECIVVWCVCLKEVEVGVRGLFIGPWMNLNLNLNLVRESRYKKRGTSVLINWIERLNERKVLLGRQPDRYAENDRSTNECPLRKERV